MEHRLYGMRTADLAATAEVLGSVLSCRFEERDSDYLGSYWMATSGDVKVKVVSQPDPEGEVLETEFSDFLTLVYVEGRLVGVELNGLVVGRETITLLRG